MEYFVEEMRRMGVRRICVLSGSDTFLMRQVTAWQAACPGDWPRVSASPSAIPSDWVGNATRQLLGQELLHAVYDATEGIHAEALAILAGTLVAGSWLLLLTPARDQWESCVDADSIRWADTELPITTPVFMQHFWQQITCDPDVIVWQETAAPPNLALTVNSPWQTRSEAEQQHVLAELSKLDKARVIVTAARGRGKSALGGMLAATRPKCLVTAPGKVSTRVLSHFAGEHYYFMAPDAILAAEKLEDWQWLIIDEAAAIPAPLLQSLIARFTRCLLLTTTDGYEGTGQGFLLKFCTTLDDIRFYSLTQPQRYRQDDPLERVINQLLLFTSSQQALPAVPESLTLHCYRGTDWQQYPALTHSTYHLLQAAHYRTTPLDLRRMMDAPGIGFLQLVNHDRCYAVVGWVTEGQQSESLAQAVWRGERRPKGNLVAQSLTAHSRFPDAMTLSSLRISRIVVSDPLRRRGVGKRLIQQMVAQTQDKDFISVSFGFSDELWQFWQRCGFQLVRVGTQREASSGCYAAMALYPLTAAGERLCRDATRHFRRDWYWQQSRFCPELSNIIGSDEEQTFLATDRDELQGFAYAHRPLTVSYPALQRAWQIKPKSLLLPALRQCLADTVLPDGVSKKDWLLQLRSETRQLLEYLPKTALLTDSSVFLG